MMKNLLFILLLAIAVTGAVVSLSPALINENPEQHQSPKLELTTVHENETATLTHIGGDTVTNNTTGLPTLAMRIEVCPKTIEDQRFLNATVEHQGRTSTTGWWVSKRNPAVSSFPITEGDSVRVLTDGNDADGDGTAGIEPGDYVLVRIFTKLGGGFVTPEGDPMPDRCKNPQ